MKKTALKAKAPVNRWKNARIAHCRQCRQATDQFDRDSPKSSPFFVKWVKANIDKQEVEHPSGRECYGCFCVRRMFVKKDGVVAKPTELEERRAADPIVDAQFWDFRKDFVGGENEHKHTEAVV